MFKQEKEEGQLIDKVVYINRVAKVVKGELGLDWRGSHSLDILSTLLLSFLIELHGSPHLGGCSEK